MNMRQVVQPRTSSNGHGRRKVERDYIARPDSKGVSSESPSRDRLIYLTTCLIGHQVEVHLMDGSVITGIFHATNAEDFGIVLKMAHLIRDGSGKQKSISDSLNKPPSRTLIIAANDLVQLIAKGVPVTKDGLSNELPHERQQELLTDSCISQSRHIEVGRELARWIPDENEPSFPDLENVFDSPWKRGWDQFETNATLFGVKSTFNEELYTTKLERGPQTRELEKEALRIAREIEGQDTVDLHLAEERGIQLDGHLEIDEETRFSSVYRPVDDSGYDETEDILLDSQNDETFGNTSPVISKPPMDMNPRKTSDETRASSRSSSVGEMQSTVSTSRDVYRSSFEDQDQQLLNENFPKESSVVYTSRVLDIQLTGRAKTSSAQEDKYKPLSLDRGGASKAATTVTADVPSPQNPLVPPGVAYKSRNLVAKHAHEADCERAQVAQRRPRFEVRRPVLLPCKETDPTIVTRILSAAAAFPPEKLRYPSISTFYPCSAVLLYLIRYIDHVMASTKSWTDNCMGWTPIHSMIYISMLFYIQVMRAMKSIGAIPLCSELFTLQLAIESRFCYESLWITGPLIQFFKNLTCFLPFENEVFGFVSPILPTTPNWSQLGTRLRNVCAVAIRDNMTDSLFLNDVNGPNYISSLFGRNLNNDQLDRNIMASPGLKLMLPGSLRLAKRCLQARLQRSTTRT